MYLCINEHPAWTQEDVRLISETVIFIHRKLLPPATKLRQGNVFTSVCDSVHRGVSDSPDRHTSPQETDTTAEGILVIN